MNAEAVSQLVTVLEKTTSPDQVPDHDKEVVEVARIDELTSPSPDGA